MSEPLRTDPADLGPLSDADRAARIEQLLLSGLDHYFGGHYEQAINFWTRVAFLERGHGRARAYIERARGALAERQRESEELLHTGVAAYEAGDLQTARDLLTRAIEQGGSNETALVFLQRLSRLDAVPDVSRRDVARSRVRRPPSLRGDVQSERTSWLLTLGACIAVVAVVLLSAMAARSWIAELPVSTPPGEPAQAEALPIVRTSETRVRRAREMFANGQLHDALRILSQVELADPLREEADRLTSEIQRRLLSGAITTPAAAAAGGTAR